MGVAVNVTDVPGQIVVTGVVMLTEGVTAAFTVIAIKLDVALPGDAQLALDVIITLTTSPFVNKAVVNVAVFVPTLTPLTCH